MSYRTPFIASLGLIAVLLFLLIKGCHPPCQEGIVVKQWTDTVRPVNPTAETIYTHPTPTAITYAHPSPSGRVSNPDRKISKPLPTATGNSEVAMEKEAGDTAKVERSSAVLSLCNTEGCSDVVTYRDTIINKPDTCLVVLSEQVQYNRIQNRRVDFFNLMPIITHHTETTKTAIEHVRFYGGGFAGIQRPYTGGSYSWSVGPAVLLTIPQGMGFTYCFDAKNNGHQLSILSSFKFKK